ncbi:hypothetical protein TSOC_000078 [Tetrabaena socialis]|uniref:Uncharacterized protein n=1 Tax=Tetrabaena socialis TaxID=47790 RepID=A0A2J8AKF7_9CHLO|nr:hypothetical protein TSOC_000078 [Tetrabaena socialis]|eukprot:PNH12990.1 hypothetical protein TSOC_000078 [Tetrabaena socialis]
MAVSAVRPQVTRTLKLLQTLGSVGPAICLLYLSHGAPGGAPRDEWRAGAELQLKVAKCLVCGGRDVRVVLEEQ